MQGAAEQLRTACLVEGIELLEPIGQGLSATVWRARWRDRDVAVKVLGEDWDVGEPRELDHPAILSVLARGRTLGRPYLVLERFPTDLSRLLDGRPLPARLLRPVLVPLLDAVEHAHRRGVPHGDLKPANVLVDPAAHPPRVALTDFGHDTTQAALELEASLRSAERDELERGVSTLPYLAPERREGSKATPPADVYAFGVLLFEVLTGRLPIGLELPSELRAGLDPRFDGLVKRLLARRPAERPSLADVRRELLRLLREDSGDGQVEPEAADMVQIPGGFVVIGDRDDRHARPMHEREVPAFWIDVHPVTHRDYQRYLRETQAARPRTWPRGRLARRLLDQPVTGVTHAEAAAYAAWAGKRLPDEFEWERAAQGPEHRRFPYGDAFDPARIEPRLGPVGRHPEGATSEGVHDLTGNGWEWTSSPFGPYQATPDPTDRTRTIRGGHDPRRPGSGSATYRAGLREDIADPMVGFRCARDVV